MAYQDQIEATEMVAFAELFEIITPSQTYYYTSYQADVVFLTKTYLKRPISRGELSFSEKLRAVKVKISAPLDTPFLAYLASFPPDQTVVKITRVFIGTSDYVQLFQGHIIGITIENRVASAECESETRLLRNKVPKVLFQAWCNHMLFDSSCGLNEADYGEEIEVDSLESPNRIVSAQLGAFDENFFALGYIRFSNDIRFIENHYTPTGGSVPTHLKIQLPFKDLEAGDKIICYPGCDKSYETCQTKFNNLANRLAFDNIPSSNPVIWGVGSVE
jgi:uncharacterized phage protein (TIGR02218 family)